MNTNVYFDRNTIYFSGVLRVENLPTVLRFIHKIVDDARYPEINLNFKNVEVFYGSFLTVLLCRIYDLHRDNINVYVESPIHPKAINFLKQTEFLLFLTNEEKANKNPRPDKNLPILHYTNDEQQGFVTDLIVKTLLFQVKNLPKENLRAVQWAVSEVTDNVLNHAKSPVGGFIYSYIHPTLNLLEVVVADAGIGIPRTLNQVDHGVALEMAITGNYILE